MSADARAPIWSTQARSTMDSTRPRRRSSADGWSRWSGRRSPYAKRIAHKGVWVEPRLLAEIEYRAKSAEGKVSHPFFKGLREDL
jgi:ATP-dependent DNA ligase